MTVEDGLLVGARDALFFGELVDLVDATAQTRFCVVVKIFWKVTFDTFPAIKELVNFALTHP